MKDKKSIFKTLFMALVIFVVIMMFLTASDSDTSPMDNNSSGSYSKVSISMR